MVPVRAGTDRKTILAIDLPTYAKTANMAPTMISGSGLSALSRDPHGVLVAPEIATDFAVGPGDNLPLTLFPDDRDKSRNMTLHVAGVYRSFPPSNPPTEMVISTASLPSYLLAPPDFYLARDAAGYSPAEAAASLRGRPTVRKTYGVGTLAGQLNASPRSLATLNLGGLQQIEVVGAALIAAVGVAVLGAFLTFERRREFAVMDAVGADDSQIVTGPALEGTIAVLGSLLVGLPLGLILAMLAVRVLGLFFTLPPPLLIVPTLPLLAVAAASITASAIAIGVALRTVIRIPSPASLREP
jgi:putative ABC transport system permease protein